MMYKIPCQRCGKIMHVPNLYRWYCEECSKLNNRELVNRIRYRKMQDERDRNRIRQSDSVGDGVSSV